MSKIVQVFLLCVWLFLIALIQIFSQRATSGTKRYKNVQFVRKNCKLKIICKIVVDKASIVIRD